MENWEWEKRRRLIAPSVTDDCCTPNDAALHHDCGALSIPYSRFSIPAAAARRLTTTSPA